MTFEPGETSKDVVVQVCGDTIDEPDETFVVNLSTPTNATIADSQAVGTIIDDERNGRFSCRASALNLLGLLEPVAPTGRTTRAGTTTRRCRRPR